MMRYQRVSPDCLSPPNGRKSNISDTTNRISLYPPFDAKPLKVRPGSASTSGSTNPQTLPDNHVHQFTSSSSDSLPPENPKPHETNGRDVLLQWGHKKRSRGPRTENRTVGDESSGHSRQHIKIQRRAAIAGAERIAAAAAAAMPPPCSNGYTRGAILRACTPLRDSTVAHQNRTVEDRSNGHPRSEKRSPSSPPERKAATAHNNSKTANVAAPNGFGPDPSSSSMNPDSKPPSEGSGSGGATARLEQLEWPRIYIALSRKEKEDDFMAMKGTKLPQRPKKRAKNIDKTLQYCFPGMWLSDLTRGRYEVREKKCVKKLQKRRGLKGMESVDSDSE